MLKRSVRRENAWYVVNLAVSLLVLYWLYSLVSRLRTSTESVTVLTMVLTYAIIIIAYVFFAKGLLVGHFRGNGIRVSEQQFPEVYRVYKEQLQKLDIKKEPKLYCVQSNGVLNAFATRMFFRNYVVIYTEILQAAYDKGMDAVAFVLAHELGHVKRGHLVKNFFIYPAAVILPLRFAYSRACEYTCDVIGREATSERGVAGLLILAAGSRLNRIVNTQEYIDRAAEEHGFWVWFAEFMSTHPNLPKRISRLRAFEASPAQP
jgi:Zn-dependent protease with chaperone function